MSLIPLCRYVVCAPFAFNSLYQVEVKTLDGARAIVAPTPVKEITPALKSSIVLPLKTESDDAHCEHDETARKLVADSLTNKEKVEQFDASNALISKLQRQNLDLKAEIETKDRIIGEERIRIEQTEKREQASNDKVNALEATARENLSLREKKSKNDEATIAQLRQDNVRLEEKHAREKNAYLNIHKEELNVAKKANQKMRVRIQVMEKLKAHDKAENIKAIESVRTNERTVSLRMIKEEAAKSALKQRDIVNLELDIEEDKAEHEQRLTASEAKKDELKKELLISQGENRELAQERKSLRNIIGELRQQIGQGLQKSNRLETTYSDTDMHTAEERSDPLGSQANVPLDWYGSK